MRWLRSGVGFVVAVTLAVSGCVDRSSAPVRATSLRDNLGKLEQKARDWKVDAYLESAEVPLHNGNPTAWLIRAHFNSPSSASESLAVMLLPNGSVEEETIEHTIPVIQIQAIQDDHWQLDSQEALERALDETGRRFLKENADFQCGFLELERVRNDSAQPVVWRLTLRECLGGGFLQHTLIDPVTGEILDRR